MSLDGIGLVQRSGDRGSQCHSGLGLGTCELCERSAFKAHCRTDLKPSEEIFSAPGQRGRANRRKNYAQAECMGRHPQDPGEACLSYIHPTLS